MDSLALSQPPSKYGQKVERKGLKNKVTTHTKMYTCAYFLVFIHNMYVNMCPYKYVHIYIYLYMYRFIFNVHVYMHVCIFPRFDTSQRNPVKKLINKVKTKRQRELMAVCSKVMSG